MGIGEIGIRLSNRIEKGSYLYDVIMQMVDNTRTQEITLGTIITRTTQTGEILSRYRLSNYLLSFLTKKKNR